MGRVAAEQRRQEPGALEELVRRYGRLIRQVAARVAGRHGVEEDVEQRVVVALWRKLDRDEPIEHPATYVYRCAVREAVRVVAEERARSGEPLDEELRSRAPEPEQALAAAELGRTLARCVAKLADERRRAVTAHLGGFSFEEIMALHGWPYQKARNLVARGMADLRARLRAEGVDVE
jgi:RNA polymerase sigma factor (sigma-70 family)